MTERNRVGTAMKETTMQNTFRYRGIYSERKFSD